MSLESIVQYIINNAENEGAKIIQEGRIAAERIISEAKIAADKLYQEEIKLAKTVYARQQQKEIIDSRLASRQKLLQVKQELVNDVFESLKDIFVKKGIQKQQVRHDGVVEVQMDIDRFVSKLKREQEAEVARLIFSDTE